MSDGVAASASSRIAVPSGLEVLDRRRVLEHVHEGLRVELRRQQLRVPGPHPLALRRLIPLEGPTGPPVLLLHGLGQNRRTWRLPGRSLEAALAHAGFEVYNLELRGHGRSAELGSEPARGLDEYVDDLRETLSRIRRPCYCAGHSLGGAVLVKAVAAGVPMAGLIHLAGVYTFAGANPFLKTVTAWSRRFRRLLDRGTPVPMGPAGRLIAWQPRMSDFLGQGAPISGWTRHSLEPTLLADRVDMGFDNVGWGVWLDLAELAGGADIDPDGRFARAQVPLLVLSGSADKLATPDDARACYDASTSADKELVIFSEATHGYAPGHIDIIVGRDAPAIVWPVIENWIRARAS